MQIKIGTFDPAKKQVPVKFTSGEIVHERFVNAVLKADGSYDRTATRLRVADVARGVAAKIEAGVISPPVIEAE